MLCAEDQELAFPFRCKEKKGYLLFPTAFHGLSSFLSSSSIAAIVPMILGIPFGSMMGLGILLAIWGAIGGVAAIFLSKPTVYSSQKKERTMMTSDGKIKTLKDGEFT
jgi:hypothetical protein